MECWRCGVKIDSDDLFCRKCGASLKRMEGMEDKLIDVAKAVAHRINNALFIMLSSAQLAMHRVRDLPEDISDELRGLIRDIADFADNAGTLMHQFQKFIGCVEDRRSLDSAFRYADQLRGSLCVQPTTEGAVSGTRDFRVISTPPSRVSHASILVVDDEEKIRHALSYALTLGGQHVITAEDGQEALSLLRKGTYDIAFVDLKMPGMDGWETASSIKKLSPDTMIVLMTGWAVPLDDERLGDIDAVLTKPFQLSEINELIERVTGAGR